MRIAATSRVIAFLSLGVAILSPQTSAVNPLPAADPVIRVSVNLVQVDAIVTDSKGNHVSDLQPGDFEILEDGKPQKITNFSWVGAWPPGLDASSANRENSVSAPNLRKEDVRRSIVLMVDDLSISQDEVLAIRTAARKFVAEQILPGDLVAITASRGGMGFYQQFTSDKQQLYSAINHIVQRTGFGRWQVETPSVFNGEDMVPIQLVRGEPSFDFRGGDTPNPLGYLTWAIQGLRDTAGRKAVVLFSRGFANPPALVDLANRAGVTIYVIDPHGPDLVIGTDGQGHMKVGGEVVPSVAPYRLLAKETGGLWIQSAPGGALGEDLGKVLEDMSGYYLLGYQPDRNDFEFSEGKPVHHNILVKLRRKGLTVRARSGFMGVPDMGKSTPEPQTKEEYLRQALFSPFNGGGIRLRVDPVYDASPPDPRTKHRLPLLHAMLAIDGGDVRFADAGEGKKTVVLDVLVAVFNEDGTQGASQSQTFTIKATPEHAAQLKATGIHGTLDVKLLKPGPYQIRAAVRDEGSGAIGSAYSFLSVPDFNSNQIVLSSIVLTSPGSAQSGRREQMGSASFTAGTTIHFACEVFGLNTARTPKAPVVDMEVRLFHEGTPVFDSQPLAVSHERLEEHSLMGNMKIGSDMVPGDYTMQLVAYDRLAPPKKQVATQWIDLTVVKASQ